HQRAPRTAPPPVGPHCQRVHDGDGPGLQDAFGRRAVDAYRYETHQVTGVAGDEYGRALLADPLPEQRQRRKGALRRPPEDVRQRLPVVPLRLREDRTQRRVIVLTGQTDPEPVTAHRHPSSSRPTPNSQMVPENELALSSPDR